MALCNAAGFDRTGIHQPSGPIITWVKYGPNVTMVEALTHKTMLQSISLAIQWPACEFPGSTRLSREMPSTFPSATLSWSTSTPQIAARGPPAGCRRYAVAYLHERSQLRASTRRRRTHRTQLCHGVDVRYNVRIGGRAPAAY